MAIKIVRILIIALILIFLGFYGLDNEAKRFEEEALRRKTRQQILEKAHMKIIKWAETEASPKKIKALRNKHGKNIEIAAIHHGAEPKLIAAITLVESGGNEHAVSPVKAIGLMGVKPIAAKDVEADPKHLKDPFYNLLIGSKYLKTLETRYRFHRLEDRLLAYNRGPDMAKAMLRANYQPATDAYVQKVFLAREKMR